MAERRGADDPGLRAPGWHAGIAMVVTGVTVIALARATAPAEHRVAVAFAGLAIIALAVDAAGSPRRPTVVAERYQRVPSFGAVVITAMALLAAGLSVADAPAWIGPGLVTIALVILTAVEATKVVFRLTVVLGLIAALAWLVVLGGHARDDEARAVLAREDGTVRLQRSTLDGRIANDMRQIASTWCQAAASQPPEGVGADPQQLDDAVRTCLLALVSPDPSRTPLELRVDGLVDREPALGALPDIIADAPALDERFDMLDELRSAAADAAVTSSLVVLATSDLIELLAAQVCSSADEPQRCTSRTAREPDVVASQPADLDDDQPHIPSDADPELIGRLQAAHALRQQLRTGGEDDPRGALEALLEDLPIAGAAELADQVRSYPADGPRRDLRDAVATAILLQQHAVELARLSVVDATLQLAVADAAVADAAEEGRTIEDRQAASTAQAAATLTSQRAAAALAAAEEELSALRERLDALADPPVRVELAQLFEDGLDVVVGTLPVGDAGEQNPVLGFAGLLLAAVLLVVGFRQLELINNRQYGTPIEVVPIKGLEEKLLQPALTQRLRERILNASGDAPGLVPGSSGGAALSTLLSEAEGLPHNKVAAALVSFLQAVAVPPAGVRATMTVHGDAATTGGLHATVELSTRVAERFVGSAIVSGADQLELVDAAACFAATNATNFSRATPEWARWDDTSGEAFRLYRAARQSRDGTRPLDAAGRTRLLEDALRRSPRNGLVRLALGHEHDLAKRRIDAFWLHLITAQDYPTMHQSRYRLATSLLMIAGDDEQLAELVADPRKPLVAQVLQRRYARLPVVKRASSPEALLSSDTFRVLAAEELSRLERLLGVGSLLLLSARGSERQVWWRLLRDQDERERARVTYITLLRNVEVQQALAAGESASSELAVLERAARQRRGRVAAARYNAACCYAFVLDHGGPAAEDAEDNAYRHLQMALRHGGTNVLTQDWVMTDPDLQPLRDADGARFTALVTQLTCPIPTPPEVKDEHDEEKEKPAVVGLSIRLLREGDDEQ